MALLLEDIQYKLHYIHFCATVFKEFYLPNVKLISVLECMNIMVDYIFNSTAQLKMVICGR